VGVMMSVAWYRQLNETVGTVLLDSRTIRARVGELGAQIAQDYQGKNPHVVAILKGACIFFADLIRSMDLGLSMDFIAVGSYGESTSSTGEVRLLKDLDESIEGRTCCWSKTSWTRGLRCTTSCRTSPRGARGR